MSLRRTGAIAKKVLRTLKHDKRSVALVLVGPILAMTIFGYAFGAEISHTPIAIVNEDTGAAGENILSKLDASALDMRRYETLAEARAALDATDVRALIHLPASFSSDLQRGEAKLELRLDGSNAQVTGHVQRQVQLAIQAAVGGPGGPRLPLTVETSYAYAAGAKYTDFLVPGIMGFAAMVFTTLLTLLAFVSERASGTLSRLLVTPVRGAEIVAGYALAFGAVAAVQGSILLGVALFVFDAMRVGSLALTLAFAMLIALVGMSLGILLSAAAKRESQAVQMFPLVIFPTLLLSGIFVPLEALPSWLQPLSWMIPPTYAVEGLRDVMLRGWGLDRVWWHLLALGGFALGFLSLAAWGMERQRA